MRIKIVLLHTISISLSLFSSDLQKLTNFFDEDNDPSNNNIHDNDDDDDDDASDIDMEITWQPGLQAKSEEKSKNSNYEKDKRKMKKHEKLNLRQVQFDDDKDDSTETKRETLELLTVDDDIDHKRDYNLRDMIKLHKQKTKNVKKLKKSQLNSKIEEKFLLIPMK